MKKFISFVMAAAMVASLVPATAFAATGEVKATASIVDAWTRTKDVMEGLNGVVSGTDVPELQLKVTSADNQQTSGTTPVQTIKISLDNATFAARADVRNGITITGDGVDNVGGDADAESFNYTAATTAQLRAFVLGTLNGVTLKTSNAELNANPYNAAQGTATELADLQNVPVDAGKTAVENRDAAWVAFAADNIDNGLGAALTTADFTYVNDFMGSGAGWFDLDNATATFVSLDTVLQYAIGKNLEGATASGFVSTKMTADEWAAAVNAANIQAVGGKHIYVETKTVSAPADRAFNIAITEYSTDEITVEIEGWLAKDDIISIDLLSTMDKTSKNATVSVDSKMVTADDLVYVNVQDAGYTASVKKTVALAEDEITNLHDNGLKVKEVVADSFQVGNEVSLKLSKGLEFTNGQAVLVNGFAARNLDIDGNEITFELTDQMLAADVDGDGLVTLTIGLAGDGLRVESTSAKAGTVGTITVKVGNLDKVVVDVVEIVDYKVIMSVDEDEDVPVIYNGVNVDNDGITDDSDHETLEITLEETFPGAWSSRQGFDITVPDGVYVTDVEVTNAENFFVDQAAANGGVELTTAQWEGLFADAYQNGDHKNFEFDKRVFDDVDHTLADDVASLTFKLTVVADPNFEGDVEIGFEGALVDTQSVVAAKFVAPYTVQAEQNDLKIDSRYTTIPTDIVVKEAADGLWDDRTAAVFVFNIEKGLIDFEDDATFTVDNDSELEIDDDQDGSVLAFTVTDSSDTAATVTISDMELFMERNIPAGEYGLELTTSMLSTFDRNGNLIGGYLAQGLFAPDADEAIVDDVTDYDNTVRADFINVITAPRDEDGFTTKITVPVGESYIIAGEVKVEIDTPAYINANGYTMLPLRAVAVALGIDNNSVLWDQSTRTATILYGNRVVSMQNGASVMYINGQAVATKAGVEITNDRTFLSLRDLGTAMNVTDISWDAATRTAYLNAGEVEA